MRTRTKIVCTIGPASREPRVLERLVEAGMDVARLNFSHGTHEEHAAAVAALREISERVGKPLAILQDLAGVKIRLGEIAGGSAQLETGAEVTLTTRPVPGDAREITVDFPDFPKCVGPGDTILLSDGDLEVRVVEVHGDDVLCRVVIGGVLHPHKGVHLPGGTIQAPSLTEKDRDDLAFGIALGVDYVGLSFVRTAVNLADARRFIAERGETMPLIAKIETHEALKNIDAILSAADAILVARGDLGVETPLEHVPFLQKMLIEKSNEAGRPVVTATQMLRSMVESPKPTRAEVADVANAILDGTDAVMLSEETAVGAYPVEATRMMSRIAADAERDAPGYERTRRDRAGSVESVPEAVADAACRLAEDIDAACVIACTQSGATARLVSKHRPRRPIIAATPLAETYRRLALVWGVVPLEVPVAEADGTDRAVVAAREAGLLRAGETAVVTGGVPFGVPASTNSIRVVVVK